MFWPCVIEPCWCDPGGVRRRTGTQASDFGLFQHDNYGGGSKNFSSDDRCLNNTLLEGHAAR